MLLHGQKVKLRAMEPSDLESMYLWENDTTLWDLGDTVLPFSRDVLASFIENAPADIYAQRQIRLIVESLEDRVAVGAVDLFDFHPRNRRAALGMLIYRNQYRGRGYGREAAELILDYAFGYLELHALYVDIPESNRSSLELFKSLGFTTDTIMRHWIRRSNGCWEDVLRMQMITP